ncbi:MAG: RNA-binding transcriptional accessory protein, partial [Moraxellaceae bacterium]|nr:RNA-binding transcriptional accessory protein [Moraxellaceae bacterium]
MSDRSVKIAQTIATEINARLAQVVSAVELLDGGATVPFIARYRKEITGGLDDTQLRDLEERLGYLREMEDRRDAILKSIEEQGKLTPELKGQLLDADTKARLEDLYLPYKPRRVTKGMLAREAGIEPLADMLLADPTRVPETEAQAFINVEKSYGDTKAVLDGAKHILMERFAENADLLARLRSFLTENSEVAAKVVPGKENEGAKFRDYFEHHEPLKSVPSHRALAMFRGRNEGFLTLALEIPNQEEGLPHPAEGMIAAHAGIKNEKRAADTWLAEVVRWTWRVKLLTHLETDLLGEIKGSAEEEAIKVFADNLKDLLMAAPAGPRATLGLDPGLRTGVKVAVVDSTGKLVDHGVIFPHEPRNEWDKSIAMLAVLCQRHNVDLIAIGNGTASRETDKLAAELIKKHSELKMTKVVVSEAGASVYSASALAAAEFPDLDVSYRGGVSIARRLQDPLAELVKIDPKSIGVGQYQHDVNQVKLARSLDAVVEDCVNAVGVDVNMASAALLARIAGLNSTIAQNIVSYRDSNGAFTSREALKKVPRLGDKTFEQAAGFLRIMNGENPLDASTVHPESYPIVQKIAAQSTKDIRELLGDAKFLKAVNAAEFVDEKFGLPTITDILKELEKPGRDPRPEFKAATFQDGVTEIRDLKPGMILEGVVTNVANFGAFVDIGVHQDGLVHISALSTKFIKDPREVVRAGDIVK